MKAKLAYLLTVGCCHFRHTPLVNLCILLDDRTIAGNILETCYSEYVSVMQTCVAGYQGRLRIFVMLRNTQKLNLLNKVDGSFFCNRFSQLEIRETLRGQSLHFEIHYEDLP